MEDNQEILLKRIGNSYKKYKNVEHKLKYRQRAQDSGTSTRGCQAGNAKKSDFGKTCQTAGRYSKRRGEKHTRERKRGSKIPKEGAAFTSLDKIMDVGPSRTESAPR
jgi:hypothetical protein